LPERPPGRDPGIATRIRSAVLGCLRGTWAALLTGRWRTLQHITASPTKIGGITRAAAVLTHFEYGYMK
jgi:hypothetical protein